MNKLNALLLATGAAVLLAAPVRPAHAIACTNCTQEVTEIGRQLERMTEMARQTMQLKQQLEAQAATLQSLTNPSAAATMLPQLMSPGSRFPLPSEAGQIGNMLSGGSPVGALSGLAQRFLQQNQVYAPPGDYFAAQQMRQQAETNANVMAMASQLHDAAGVRLNNIAGLQAALQTAPDIKAVADIQARVGIEQIALQAQQQQAQVLTLRVAAQQRAEEQGRDQEVRAGADRVLDRLRATAQGLGQ